MNKINARPRVVLVNRAIIFDKDNKFLLVRRSDSDHHLPGLWEFPRGKLEQDQDISESLHREVFEETGLQIDPAFQLVYVESELLTKGKFKGLPYIILFSVGKTKGGPVRLSNEHSDYAWITKDQSVRYNLKPEIKRALSKLDELLQNIESRF